MESRTFGGSEIAAEHPLPTPSPARPAAEQIEYLGSADRVSVYVYDDVPELDFSGLIECYRQRNDGVPPWQDEIMDMAQDMGEVWLHRALLSHPWRVLDPWQADLFYIPMYPVLSFKVELGGGAPWEPKNLTRINENSCLGLTHTARMDAAVEYLSLSSLFFNRFGGADHVVVCAWWYCRGAVSSAHRMLLQRTVVGINEKNKGWCRWGCGSRRMVTVPYTASSVLTTSGMIGGRPPEERDIPLFFVGTARNRPERMNLDVVKNVSGDSVILLGDDARDWGMNSRVYAEHMARSRFCFCPRGDTPSSRRIFDALAAGCIPIVTETGMRVLPYVEIGLNYSEIAMVVGPTAFSTRENAAKTALNALAMSDKELAELRKGSAAALTSIVYGVSSGTSISDMHPFQETATKFLQASYQLTEGGAVETRMWNCPTDPKAKLDPRTEVELPPVPGERRQWLAESETIVNKERSLLFCAAPNAGSLQFRMLAKRMQGVSHWSESADWSLLFDPEDSELELLDVTDGPLMKKIYSDNGSGWIKIAVVRDPVTRLLSAYLDIARTWRAGLRNQKLKLEKERQSGPPSPAMGAAGGTMQEQSPGNHDLMRQLWHAEGSTREVQPRGDGGKELLFGGTSSEWELFDVILEHRRHRQEGGTARSGNDPAMTVKNDIHQEAHEEKGDSWDGWNDPFEDAEQPPGGGEWAEGHANRALDAGDSLLRDGVVFFPTFAEVVEALKDKPWKAPAAFRPIVSLCGMRNSPFDSIIPFERLQKTSTEVLKSLPGDTWESFGASGWGPDGKHAFMEFDYGRAAWRRNVGGIAEGVKQEGKDWDPLPRHTRDLFEGESCAWAEYYGDKKTLEAVGRLYASDYGMKRATISEQLHHAFGKKTSTEVLKSLPGDTWESFGASGWGPDGKHAFMGFDYGAVASRKSAGVHAEGAQREDTKRDWDPPPRRASELFEGASCKWVGYYGDMETLEAVSELYAPDYSHFRWFFGDQRFSIAKGHGAGGAVVQRQL
eukprot:g9922.t1